MSTTHLSPDELDALLVGVMSATVRSHLADCGLCRAVASTDRAVVIGLERLPRFSPRIGFSDRVMLQVDVPKPVVRSILGLRFRVPTGRGLALAASVAVIFLAGVTTSVVWSLGHRDVLAGWGQQAMALLDNWLWLGLRALAANVAEQPWYEGVRGFFASPARAAVGVLGLLTTWSLGVIALKRLVSLPTRAA
ncbi:MAG TPA: hypothetical protein VJU15_16120 [Gemmatimonadales bacterium]|nr:hypothetical protein [Gemmatimonadales bacterium]